MSAKLKESVARLNKLSGDLGVRGISNSLHDKVREMKPSGSGSYRDKGLIPAVMNSDLSDEEKLGEISDAIDILEQYKDDLENEGISPGSLGTRGVALSAVETRQQREKRSKLISEIIEVIGEKEKDVIKRSQKRRAPASSRGASGGATAPASPAQTARAATRKGKPLRKRPSGEQADHGQYEDFSYDIKIVAGADRNKRYVAHVNKRGLVILEDPPVTDRSGKNKAPSMHKAFVEGKSIDEAERKIRRHISKVRGWYETNGVTIPIKGTEGRGTASGVETVKAPVRGVIELGEDGIPIHSGRMRKPEKGKKRHIVRAVSHAKADVLKEKGKKKAASKDKRLKPSGYRPEETTKKERELIEEKGVEGYLYASAGPGVSDPFTAATPGHPFRKALEDYEENPSSSKHAALANKYMKRAAEGSVRIDKMSSNLMKRAGVSLAQKTASAIMTTLGDISIAKRNAIYAGYNEALIREMEAMEFAYRDALSQLMGPGRYGAEALDNPAGKEHEVVGASLLSASIALSARGDLNTYDLIDAFTLGVGADSEMSFSDSKMGKSEAGKNLRSIASRIKKIVKENSGGSQ